MARIESFVKDVQTYNVNSTISLYEKFGWALASTQEIVKTDLETYGTSVINIETKHRSTVKLMFQRDKDMPNYMKIVELERKYYRLLDDEKAFKNENEPSSRVAKRQVSKWWNALPIIAGVISIGFVGNLIYSIGIVACGMILISAIDAVLQSRKKKGIKKQLTEFNKKCINKKENTEKEQKVIFEQLKELV